MHRVPGAEESRRFAKRRRLDRKSDDFIDDFSNVGLSGFSYLRLWADELLLQLLHD